MRYCAGVNKENEPIKPDSCTITVLLCYGLLYIMLHPGFTTVVMTGRRRKKEKVEEKADDRMMLS